MTAKRTDSFVPATTRTTIGRPPPAFFINPRECPRLPRRLKALPANRLPIGAVLFSPTVQTRGPLLLIYSAGPAQPAAAQSTLSQGAEAQLRWLRDGRTPAVTRVGAHTAVFYRLNTFIQRRDSSSFITFSWMSDPCSGVSRNQVFICTSDSYVTWFHLYKHPMIIPLGLSCYPAEFFRLEFACPANVLASSSL